MKNNDDYEKLLRLAINVIDLIPQEDLDECKKLYNYCKQIDDIWQMNERRKRMN